MRLFSLFSGSWRYLCIPLGVGLIGAGCADGKFVFEEGAPPPVGEPPPEEVSVGDWTAADFPAIAAVFGGTIDVEQLVDYAASTAPDYVSEDNTDGNAVTPSGATLGRVLFYDLALSADDTVSCSSCHEQAFAFSDQQLMSTGIAGNTARHAMRLVNARFSAERRFFWDERAESLEEQTTQPIRDHIEMGYSGEAGDPAFAELLIKLSEIAYYPELFVLAFGDEAITEERIQRALAQFIRSIESFDSRFDEGRQAVGNDQEPFPGFSEEENTGKRLFVEPPQFDTTGGRTGGGAGCAACHRAPTFGIDPGSGNNGVTGTPSGEGIDTTVTRSPSLRDIFNPEGELNGPLFHDGSGASFEMVLDHYDAPQPVEGTDRRLASPSGLGQRLNLTAEEKQQLTAFMKTLTGRALYTDSRWSDPF